MELECGASWVEHVSWSTDSTKARILATSAGKKIKFWSADGILIGEALDQQNTISDIQWNPEENILASISYGGIKLWSPDISNELRIFDWQGSALKIHWSPDTRFIATGDQDSTVHFWFVETGQAVCRSKLLLIGRNSGENQLTIVLLEVTGCPFTREEQHRVAIRIPAKTRSGWWRELVHRLLGVC